MASELLYQQQLPGAGNHGYPGAYGAVHCRKAEGGLQGPRRRLCRRYHAVLPTELVDNSYHYIEKCTGEGSAYRMSIRHTEHLLNDLI